MLLVPDHLLKKLSSKIHTLLLLRNLFSFIIIIFIYFFLSINQTNQPNDNFLKNQRKREDDNAHTQVKDLTN